MKKAILKQEVERTFAKEKTRFSFHFRVPELETRFRLACSRTSVKPKLYFFIPFEMIIRKKCLLLQKNLKYA